MKLILAITFIGYLSSLVNALDLPMDDDVYIITDKNYGVLFNHTRDTEGAMLLYFYDESVTPQKDYYSEYKKAAKVLARNKEKIYCSKVYKRANYKIATFFKIEETPRIVVINSGEKMLHRYYEEEERTAEDLLFWARRIIAPGPKVFRNMREFKRIFNRGHHLVVGVFEDEQSPECKAFIKGGVICRYVNFAYTLNTTLGEELGLEDPTNAVAFFYKQEMMNHTETKILRKTNSSETIYQFVKENHNLPIDLYTKYSDLYYDSEKMMTLLLFDKIDLSKENKAVSFYRTHLSGIYEDLKNKTQFAVSSEDEWRHLNYLLDTSREVELVARKNQQWYKSLAPVSSSLDPFNFTLVKEFIDDVYYDRIEPFVRSQEPFVKNNTNGIINLVGRNFNEFTNQTGHEFIIMFYVPWNPRCAKFRTELEALANGPLKEIENFHVVQMEADKNYVPPLYQVGEMPTIYFLKDQVKHRPMIYKSGYSRKQMIGFLELYSDLYQAHVGITQEDL
ncbi:unnamed protein product [Moneuplotes crassus]|uniref:protein disulfide-isomerase n=1 Tax=Euplotes crassus TaxID=5936 RepID=A0AAD1U9N6_EUPCR|nr:unnamed protein product [Moneuplotes crassus]